MKSCDTVAITVFPPIDFVENIIFWKLVSLNCSLQWDTFFFKVALHNGGANYLFNQLPSFLSSKDVNIFSNFSCRFLNPSTFWIKATFSTSIVQINNVQKVSFHCHLIRDFVQKFYRAILSYDYLFILLNRMLSKWDLLKITKLIVALDFERTLWHSNTTFGSSHSASSAHKKFYARFTVLAKSN